MMDLPDFNTGALESLTKKIQDNLKKPASGGKKGFSGGKARGGKKDKTDKKDGPAQKTSNEDKLVEKNKAEAGQRTNGADKLSKGKKRLHDGQVKESGNEAAKSNRAVTEVSDKYKNKSNEPSRERGSHQPEKNTPKKSLETASGRPKPRSNGAKVANSQPANGSTKHPSIQDEILALGGTEEDLTLVNDILSESEVEGSTSKTSDGKLVSDLHRTLKDLGIAGLGVQDASSQSAHDEDEELEEPEEESNPNGIALKPRLPRKEVEKDINGKGLHTHLAFEPCSEWHTVELPSIPVSSKPHSSTFRDTIDRVHQHAKSLLENENNKYASRNGSSSAQQFYSTIMSSGTLSDKISALTLSVQESPIHNMRALESLIGLASKRSRGQAVEVLGALKDLLGPGALLPSDRKLRVFAAQPGLSMVFTKAHTQWKSGDTLPSPLKDVHLISWAYEDWLKSMYFDVLKIIETWCNDEVVFARGKAVGYVYELLRDKPEQEANLLRLLVNKLGDSDKKIASKTSYNILQLETTHPLMKPLIISSIESDVIFRPGQSLHAKYYAIITLNQTVLSGKEEAVAKKLLDIYFSLFITLLAKPKSEPAKPTLSDVNAVTINKKGEKQGGGGAAGKKALKKLASQAKNTTVDDDLREKMLSGVLTGVNRAIPFTTTDEEAFERHLDTLFRVTHSSNFNTSIQALMLIQQLCASNQASVDRFYRTLYESLLDPRLLTSSKQAMYLNLLFRALRSDLKVKRVKAFAKRLLQVVAMHQASFTCGVIYLLRELEGVFANLQAFIDQPEENESDDEEEFRDAPEGDDDIPPVRPGQIQASNGKEQHIYDGKKRDPEHSNAEKSCLWELTPFLMHFHPSVALFATKLLTHEVMPVKPDLSTNTLIHFLDRFVYRNPKKTASGHKGASIMQPMAGGDTSGLLVSARSKKGAQAPVNTEAFWKMEGGKVSADEVFFHKYFNTMGRGKEQARKKKVEKGFAVDEGSEDEENEEEIWKALVNSRPEFEGSDDSDGELGVDDLESSMGLSENEAQEDAMDGVDDDSIGDEGEELDFSDDDGAVLGSDDEVPSDLDMAFQDKVQFNSDKAADPAPEEGKHRKKRRRLKNLPTFASADDYAAMLDGDGDDLTLR